jgi:hypothetical protein
MNMSNPYADLPDFAFWRRAVSRIDAAAFDPITEVPFGIAQSDRVATAGSCFAQHISRTLAKEGFNFLVTEAGPQSAGAVDQNYGVFPARFGNIYTVRQLLQLFQRAYGLFAPVDRAWLRSDGKFVDPFRPQIQDAGFETPELLEADREAHLVAVQEMFETCDVFIFTLGLTEAWISREDGAVFPLAAGVVADGSGEYGFENFSIESMVSDLTRFFGMLRDVNPEVRAILTVSPVPLIATFEPRHVLVSTTYSKSALRVVAEIAARSLEDIAYFPSYEIITGPQARGRYYADDLRDVTPEGVAHVMSVFKRHYLDGNGAGPALQSPRNVAGNNMPDAKERQEEFQVICDEEALDA